MAIANHVFPLLQTKIFSARDDAISTCVKCKATIDPVKRSSGWKFGVCDCEKLRQRDQMLAEIDKQSKEKIAKWIQNAAIPKRLSATSIFSSFKSTDNPRALNAAKLFLEYHINHCINDAQGINLVLYSQSNGVGKTMLSICIANELFKKAAELIQEYDNPHALSAAQKLAHVRFISGVDLYRLSFNQDDREIARRWNDLKTAQLLIIDDAGKEPLSKNGSTWTPAYYFEILEERYSNERSTIFTTNTSFQQICGDVHGNAILDRIAGSGYYVTLTGNSKRVSPFKRLTD